MAELLRHFQKKIDERSLHMNRKSVPLAVFYLETLCRLPMYFTAAFSSKTRIGTLK
jgi:hypothetical protein